MKTLYQPGIFKDVNVEKVRDTIEREGYNPILFTNKPGDSYQPHSHAETKLLVFIRGEMNVTVAANKYKCSAGDKLIIPGNVVHSAVVGDKGCAFFWSEKIL